MALKKAVVLGLAVFMFFLSYSVSFGEGENVTPAEQDSEVAEVQNDANMQWVWGEVSSVDTQNSAIKVKYLDYETDQEKEIVIGVDQNTIYENVSGVAEIKPAAIVGIDYIVSGEGKNIAKNISVEIEEQAPSPEAPAQ